MGLGNLMAYSAFHNIPQFTEQMTQAGLHFISSFALAQFVGMLLSRALNFYWTLLIFKRLYQMATGGSSRPSKRA